MTKPSQELLRRAREWCDKNKWFNSSEVGLAEFAKQIVRECAEIARDKATYANTGTFTVKNRVMLLRETAGEILRKFGLEP